MWVERLARWGLASRGLVYLVVAALTAELATGNRSRQPSGKGAVEAIASQPLGMGLVVLLAVGFLAYGGWRILVAVAGPRYGPGEEDRPLGRARAAGQGVLYVVLAAGSVLLVSGAATTTGSGTARLVATVLRWPAGGIAVALVGAAIGVGGVAMAVSAVREKFVQSFDRSEVPFSLWRPIIVSGVAGGVLRGAVFALIGGLLVDAAVTGVPGKAHGLGGSIVTLAGQPYGLLLLFAVSAGLALYGVFCVALARYRKM